MGIAAAVAIVGVPATPAMAHAVPWDRVVVTGSGADAAAAAVRAAGGRVLAPLPVVQGVAAELPDGTQLSPQWTVVPARSLHVAASTSATTGSPTAVRAALGLPANGTEGRGVTVAVVDTGIADVPDLAGKVSQRVDETGTGDGDGYGHGTFMAGLIAASGASSDGTYRGAAPGASLVDVKVADATGQTDLVTVLRGLEWVSEHAQDVDVVNLSLSSGSPLPYQLDPLDQALEALWRKGITVVVPSGNDGTTVSAPGNDPVLLTAGALDASGTAVADWSGRGPTWQGDAKPDLAAPGTSLVSLRSPGSEVDLGYPGSRIGTGYFVGSGTSMATAVLSAVTADALAASPRLRPDGVKDLVVSTATELTPSTGGGAGGLAAARVLAAAPAWHASVQPDRDAAALRADAPHWAAFAKALADNDRAAAYAAWLALSPLSRDWAGRAWAQLDQATKDWVGRAWAGRAWASGPDGTAQEWLGRAWAGRAWAGRAWADADWAGRAWAGRAWSEVDWAGRAWADTDWAGRSWADTDWAGRAWSGRAWSARAWAWLS